MKLLLCALLLGAAGADTVPAPGTCQESCLIPGNGQNATNCKKICNNNNCWDQCKGTGKPEDECFDCCRPLEHGYPDFPLDPEGCWVECSMKAYYPENGLTEADCEKICKISCTSKPKQALISRRKRDSYTCSEQCRIPGHGPRPASCDEICIKDGCVEKCMNSGKGYKECLDRVCYPSKTSCYSECGIPGGGPSPIGVGCDQICARQGCTEKCMLNGKEFRECLRCCYVLINSDAKICTLDYVPKPEPGRVKRGCPIQCDATPDGCRCPW